MKVIFEMYDKAKLLPLLDGPVLKENLEENKGLSKEAKEILLELRENEDDFIRMKNVIDEKVQILNAY